MCSNGTVASLAVNSNLSILPIVRTSFASQCFFFYSFLEFNTRRHRGDFRYDPEVRLVVLIDSKFSK